MRLFFSAVISVVFFACGDNPLAERVDELEQRLDEVEAAQEEDQLSLLTRLDALAVTADNAEEIVAVRAKLNQTSITRSEFTALRNRVTALERQIVDWSRVVSSLQRSVYAVLAVIWNESYSEDDDVFVFTGTGFAVDSGTLVTNGHVIDALIEWNDYIEDFNQTNGTEWISSWIVVQNLTTSLDESNFFYLQFYRQHPEWDGDNSSPDIGLLYIWEGRYISRRVTLATSSEARRLKVGAPIATLGFPGELQGGDGLSNLFPIATFKNGTISALRPRFEDESYSAPRDTYIVQHNLDLSGGTSGSPIFDASGKVVAINNAGIDADFSGMGIDGDWPQISQAALDFGIRADKIHELLNEAGVAAKPTASADPDNDKLINRLEGRAISSLDIATTQEDLAERLAGMQ